MQKKIFQKLNQIKNEKGAGYFVLLDPDKQPPETLVEMACLCESRGVDGLLIGGSLLFSTGFDQLIQSIKAAVSIPVILFPGNGMQVSGYADAILFMSLVSGRNPHYLIGEQVHAAPKVKALDLETIATAYMIVESGRTTSAQFMSNTTPIPRHKPEIAVAHGLAAQYFGMSMVYLEAGSGAQKAIPDQMIQAMAHHLEMPLMVGGGIRTPEEALQKVKAGASFVVTGTILEETQNAPLIAEFADAVHGIIKA